MNRQDGLNVLIQLAWRKRVYVSTEGKAFLSIVPESPDQFDGLMEALPELRVMRTAQRYERYANKPMLLAEGPSGIQIMRDIHDSVPTYKAGLMRRHILTEGTHNEARHDMQGHGADAH